MRLPLDHEKLGHFRAFAFHFSAGLPLLDAHRLNVLRVPYRRGNFADEQQSANIQKLVFLVAKQRRSTADCRLTIRYGRS